jgi:hypothetical protein
MQLFRDLYLNIFFNLFIPFYKFVHYKINNLKNFESLFLNEKSAVLQRLEPPCPRFSSSLCIVEIVVTIAGDRLPRHPRKLTSFVCFYYSKLRLNKITCTRARVNRRFGIDTYTVPRVEFCFAGIINPGIKLIVRSRVSA